MDLSNHLKQKFQIWQADCVIHNMYQYSYLLTYTYSSIVANGWLNVKNANINCRVRKPLTMFSWKESKQHWQHDIFTENSFHKEKKSGKSSRDDIEYFSIQKINYVTKFVGLQSKTCIFALHCWYVTVISPFSVITISVLQVNFSFVL